jgi:hypothetical protein
MRGGLNSRQKLELKSVPGMQVLVLEFPDEQELRVADLAIAVDVDVGLGVNFTN